MSALQTWITVLGAAGVLGFAGQILRGWWGWHTGRSGRVVQRARDAITAMGEASEWADAYYRYRAWCIRTHGYDPGAPPPPDDHEDATHG